MSRAGIGAGARWTVYLPTAGATCVRLRLRARSERDPWAFALAVTELTRAGAVATARFRSLGRGRGEPVLASQELSWCGCPLHLEAGPGELMLELPSWDEMQATAAGEEAFWELVDGVAAAVDAAGGAIGDGEPLEIPGGGPAPAATLGRSALGRHLALLVPAPDATTVPGWLAGRYRELPRSGLAVLLR